MLAAPLVRRVSSICDPQPETLLSSTSFCTELLSIFASAIVARRHDLLPNGLRFLTAAIVPQLFDFPVDMDRVEAEPNHLNTQALVRYYEREWREVNR